MNVMTWIKQPTTLVGIAVVIGAGVFWFTRDAALASLVAGVPLLLVNDHTGALAKQTDQTLARVEAVEDAVRAAK